MLKVLDLCCGGQSVGLALHEMYGEQHVHYVTLDVDYKSQATFNVDIREWDYSSHFPPGYFDVIWASPPCTEYSRAKTRGVRRLGEADSIAKKVFEIIDFYEPAYWFVENPATGLLKTRDFMRQYRKYYHECTYCKYGRPYKKPTSIWTNKPGLSLKHCTPEPCDHKTLYGIHAACSQSGLRKGFLSSTRRSAAYAIPRRLVLELFSGIYEEKGGGPVPVLGLGPGSEPEPQVEPGEAS